MPEETRFIGEPIIAEFDQPPLLAKTPGCPDRFIWRNATHEVNEMLREWSDFRRRGRFASNMRPEHAAVAATRGSWGVGRFFFRVRTAGGDVYDLYYDRAPKNVDDRHGHWVLYRQLETE